VAISSRVLSALASTAAYVPRRPHETVLYGIVCEHLATFLAYTERTYAVPLPRHVVETFEQYLTCGDQARGFVRCPRDGCGHDELVVFSCNAGACARAVERGGWPPKPRRLPTACPTLSAAAGVAAAVGTPRPRRSEALPHRR
jgi:hypothetical protein